MENQTLGESTGDICVLFGAANQIRGWEIVAFLEGPKEEHISFQARLFWDDFAP
jgi:hypothetical protein